MLTEKQGLRFDIYERVHLAGEVKGLEQLDQLELLPYIQVLTQGDQAVLKGHLQLTGQFTGAEGLRESKLEHTIPVEITLPMNRIPNLEEIGVDIENFDIDLVAPKTLNVTGVLSLTGIELTPSAPEWQDKEKQEEEVFVHQAALETRNEAKEAAVEATEETPAVPVVSEPMPVQELPAQPPVMEQPAQEQVPEPIAAAEPEEAMNNKPVAEELPAVEASEPGQLPAAEVNEALENEAAAENENAEMEPAAEEEPIAKPSEKKDMKIAITGRKPEAEEQKDQHQLKSLIKENRTQASGGTAAAVDSDKSSAAKAKKDAVEWKRLFLSKEADELRFQSVRMCIVQKEETMDSIAQRYSLNPREIMLYNRMNEQSVSEGQILYIPRK